MSAKLALCGAALGLSLGVGTSSEARAYSDLERFEWETLVGGGGGRYFTGSPVDGYGCDVCHQGAPEPTVRVFGLPEDGYVPGRTYEVKVEWDYAFERTYAFHLEMLGRDGLAAGALDRAGLAFEVPELPTCDESVYVQSPTDSGRAVLGIEECGGASARFLFTAPDTPDLAFTLSAVTSDGQGSPMGDGAVTQKRLLRRVGEPVPAEAGCAAVGSRTSAGSVALWALVCGLLGMRRCRSRAGRPATR